MSWTIPARRPKALAALSILANKPSSHYGVLWSSQRKGLQAGASFDNDVLELGRINESLLVKQCAESIGDSP